MNTAAEGPALPVVARCFHELFEGTARRVPDRIALVCNQRQLTYAELNRKANRLARHLRALGVGEGTCVALCLPRSADMIVALLGVMKSGGAYVPLLPESPRLRIEHQLAETEAPVVVTTREIAKMLPPSARALRLDEDEGDLLRHDDADLSPTARPDSVCYVIYTSGSTGTPKGVAVRHDNLVNYTSFICRLLRLDDHDSGGGLSFATVSTLAADLGNTCVFPALASGGCLHVIPHDLAMDGALYAEGARRSPIDVLKITPSHLSALLAGGGVDVLPRRYLVTGGEASPWKLVGEVRAISALKWINHYGPTETTVGSLTLDLDLEESQVRPHTEVLPIGRPIANTRLYILDEERRAVAPGEIGELYIAGAGVAAGYLKQPERTAERFLPEPDHPDGRMYRTGDRVRQLPNGAIEFLGRVDHQVKIRGFRVELGEIEATLAKSPGVREAVVVAREGRSQELKLIAYVVGVPGPPLDVRQVRAHLRAALPEQMVPAIIVEIPKLPLTPNGKVDRKALPEPEAEDAPASTEPPPSASTPAASDGLEEQICQAWKQLLGVRRISVDDSFFELGGDSLTALHMLANVRVRTGKVVPSQVLFQNPTVRGLLDHMRGGGKSEFRSLVMLRKTGSRPPLFCVHGGGGEVYWYRNLADRLGADQPFYALQARREDDGKIRTRRVEQMATFYLEEIKRVQPQGPYFLAGASFGGKVAFEMAHMLLGQGERVALLAMFDTWGPGYPQVRPDIGPVRRRAFWLYQRIGHHLGSLWYLDAKDRLPYLRDKARRAWLESKWAVEDLVKERKRRQAEARGEDPGELAIPSSFIKEASDHYVARPYAGKIVLYRSKRQQLDFVPSHALGWDSVASDLEIYDVPGIHATMVVEPRVRFLAEKFAPVLDRAQRQVAEAPAVSPPRRSESESPAATAEGPGDSVSEPSHGF